MSGYWGITICRAWLCVELLGNYTCQGSALFQASFGGLPCRASCFVTCSVSFPVSALRQAIEEMPFACCLLVVLFLHNIQHPDALDGFRVMSLGIPETNARYLRFSSAKILSS